MASVIKNPAAPPAGLDITSADVSGSAVATPVSAIKAQVRAAIYAQRERFIGLAHDIHAHPELAFSEAYAAARITEILAEEGFAVRKGVYGLPTAFVASIGEGRLHVAFCAEYDALSAEFLMYGSTPPDSVAGGPAARRQVPPGCNVHACGHNLIAGAAVAAAAGLRELANAVGLKVSVIGTPGEELLGLKDPPTGFLSSGKIVLLERGAFDGVHAALMIHPGPTPYSVIVPSKASLRLHARFSPAGAGASGFDAAEARRLETALRASITAAHQSLYFALVKPRGEDAWTPGGRADIFWGAPTLGEVLGVRDAVRQCFQNAGTAAGVSVAVTEYVANAEMHHDSPLTAAYRNNAAALGREREHAPQMQAEIREMRNAFLRSLVRNPRQIPKLFTFATHPPVGLFMEQPPVEVVYGTDLGNVSHVIPAIHPMIGIGGTAPNHAVAFAAQADTDAAYGAMLDGGVALAWTALDAATDAALKGYLLAPRERSSR